MVTNSFFTLKWFNLRSFLLQLFLSLFTLTLNVVLSLNTKLLFWIFVKSDTKLEMSCCRDHITYMVHVKMYLTPSSFCVNSCNQTLLITGIQSCTALNVYYGCLCFIVILFLFLKQFSKRYTLKQKTSGWWLTLFQSTVLSFKKSAQNWSDLVQLSIFIILLKYKHGFDNYNE